jgi:putative heme-binding domain-containing protein
MFTHVFHCSLREEIAKLGFSSGGLAMPMIIAINLRRSANAILIVAMVLGWMAPTTIFAEEATSLPDTHSDDKSTSPAPADALALDEGKSMFRGLCSGCHGGAGRGGKGPNLTDQRWLHGDTDADIAKVIQNGVRGTTMKKLGESLKEEQIAKIIAYIRSLTQGPGDSDWKPYYLGDSAEGEKLFFATDSKAVCNKCHQLNRRGGGIGPALDRIASRRSPQYIMEAIVRPSLDIDPQYEQVMVVTDRGKTIQGLRINESNFSIQLREENGQFHSLNKKNLEELKKLETSIMPNNLDETLTVKQLHDLFSFLIELE